MTTGDSPARDLLPAPRRPDATYRIALVCLGNICRSPMAETVLRDRVELADMAGRIDVGSFGTGGWHVGRPMDPRAAAVLADHGYDGSRHQARQFHAALLEEYDLILVMDELNHADVTSLDANRDDLVRVRLFRDFDPRADGSPLDVPDPYYGGDHGFLDVLAIVERTADALVGALIGVSWSPTPGSRAVGSPARDPRSSRPAEPSRTTPIEAG